ncbi:hypothetical protein F5148DRAFT_250824 [Russula earlei]|uniref:Uncharacterized protein n=1 Tax=Russula earlei TaxID=71964 RepID=A0ACC0U441_9AGAM|nr:hypothetical protein F5148DRAFT_250824 [Russula earlei]
MSQYIDFLDDPIPGSQPGGINQSEKWWVERQEALERAGYLLRTRYRSGWKPSWTGTRKFFLDVEDGLSIRFRLGMDATRISDGKPVMLKMLPFEEGPHELEINKLFSIEPLYSDARNHCVQLLDVIQLPDDPPIIVHPMLRPFYNPPLQTFGEVRHFLFPNMRGRPIHAREPRCPPGLHVPRTLCLTHRICIPSRSTPLRSNEVRISAERLSGTHELAALRGTSLSTLACPVDTTLPMGHHWKNHCVVETSQAPEHQGHGTHHVIHFLLMYTISETWFESIISRNAKASSSWNPLVTDMIQDDPMKRPSMDEVVSRFSEIRGKLSTWKLRSRIARNMSFGQSPLGSHSAIGTYTVGYVLGRKAAIPEPEMNGRASFLPTLRFISIHLSSLSYCTLAIALSPYTYYLSHLLYFRSTHPDSFVIAYS